MDNLLSNAIKYSPPKSDIQITAEMKENSCMFCVSDNGIVSRYLVVPQRVDELYRADRSDTAVSGLGLGMSIVKQIIEDHGGKISVESIVSHGTKVFFTLPIER